MGMKALVQRVSEASVTVGGAITGRIGRGLLVFLGVKNGDTEREAIQLAKKVVRLRIFGDDEGRMNLSLHEVGGGLLVISQFTLYGDTSRGNRPSYSDAARPEAAQPLYDTFVAACRELGVPVSTGVFQAHMDVRLINDGPVTLMCTSERLVRQNQ
jgi:D-aminoacyl-tRNA deacylase